MINATSTDWAPWYIIPADNKWVTRALVADIITTALNDLNLKFPELDDEQLKLLEQSKKTLNEE